MSDHSHLLEDPRNAAAVTAFIRPQRGHTVVGLHDDVMVRDVGPGRLMSYDIFTGPVYENDGKTTEPYPTVEVILVTATGRPYAQRYRFSLAQFLDLVHDKVAA